MAHADERNEATPLLEDTSLLQNPHRAGPASGSTNYIWKLVPLAIALLILDTSGYLSLGAETAIFEQTACRVHYGSEANVDISNDWDCKIAPIQSEVAFLIGWKEALETVPGILCAAPFGALADRIGRKKVLLFSLLGCFLSDTWVRLVCFFPEVFPLRGVLASGLFSFLGGGTITVSSLAWAMVADEAPAEKRTAAFSYVQAALLVAEFVAVAISAPLIAVNPWIPYLAASVWMLAGIAFTVLFVGDTPINKQSAVERLDANVSSTATSRVADRANEVIRWIRANMSVVLLLVSFFVVQLGRQIANILIQYVSIKFSWTISQASYLIMVRSITSLVILVALPFISKNVSTEDLPARLYHERRLTQFSGLFLVAGSLVTFIAFQPVVLVLGQVLFGLGSVFTVTARSVVTGLIGKQHIGTLYGLIAVTSYGGALVGGPLIAKAFSIGLDAGGIWKGLPFLVTGALFFLALLAVSVARLPAPAEENT